jgi:hypothetical protein
VEDTAADFSAVWPALLMSSLAGLATAAGGLMAVFGKKSDGGFLSAALGFSAGVMLLVSFGELLPDSKSVPAARARRAARRPRLGGGARGRRGGGNAHRLSGAGGRRQQGSRRAKLPPAMLSAAECRRSRGSGWSRRWR